MMDDMISRKAAIDAIRMDISIIPFAKAREYVRATIEEIYNRLEELPSAQPERKRGEWEQHIFDGIMGGRPRAWMCNYCNTLAINRTNYCPNCGADMRGEQDG